ncbi:transposase [Granulicella mallensis]|uniref:Transposase n=1 Tax=Granulicella mallensis TaxID=940614 RepID=A0A7W7ZQ01_9BACT|nr:transposase [Granulicella mallensis]
MSKRSIQLQETMYCGIDVSAKSLTVAIQRVGQPVEQESFANNPIGHKALIVWLQIWIEPCATGQGHRTKSSE